MTCGDVTCNHDRERKMVVVERGLDGVPTVWCDPCIATIVSALNAAGVKTVASCCGHGRRPGNILLTGGRELIIADSFEQARAIDAAFASINDPLSPDQQKKTAPIGKTT